MTPEELIAKYGNERDCGCGYAPNPTELSGERYRYCYYHLQMLLSSSKRQHLAPAPNEAGYMNPLPPNLDDQLIQILCNLKYCEFCGCDEDSDGNGRSSLDVDEAFKQIKALFHAEDAPVLPPETRP